MASSSNDDQLIGHGEAARLLQIKPATLYAWVCHRKIPVRKHGRLNVFSRKELLAWSEAQAITPYSKIAVINRSMVINPPAEKGQPGSSLKTNRTVESPDSRKETYGDKST